MRATTVADPFDPAALRLALDFEEAGARRVLTNVPLHKPGRQELVRVHPGEDYPLETGLVELKDCEHFLVHPQMRAELAEEMILARPHSTVSRDVPTGNEWAKSRMRQRNPTRRGRPA